MRTTGIAFLFGVAMGSQAALAQALPCDLREYKAADGLKAEAAGDGLQVSWQGEREQQLRASFAIRGGQPMVRELAVRKNGAWVVLGRDLVPEFEVTTGRRRIS